MLARLIRRYVLFHMLLGAGLAYAWGPHGLPMVLVLGLGALLWPILLQWLVIAVSMAMSYPTPSTGSLASHWRALWAEVRAALTVYLLRQAWAGPAPGVQAPLSPSPSRAGREPLPVVLVHGYICNHRVWDTVAKALRRAGHTVIAVDLEPLFTSIDDYTDTVAQAVTDLQAATGAKQVALVGHSMGGLVIRAWMRAEGLARVAKVITLGTPHQGTQIVKAATSANSAQMVWHSDWLQELARSETPASRALMHLGLTTHDNIVYPQREQTLNGAALTEFVGLGHLEMCLSPSVIDWLLAQLAPAPASLAAPDSAVPVDQSLQRPHSLRALFWAFTSLALQGFGGVVAIVQREMVDHRRWMTREQFIEDWAVSQVLPGPNVVNLSLMIGDRYFGWRGGLVALAGLLVFPLLILLLVALVYSSISNLPAVQGALRGMGAVAAGMITATGLKLMPSLAKNVLGRNNCYAIAGLTFAAIAWLHFPLVWVLLGLGGAVSLLAYLRLDATPAEEAP